MAAFGPREERVDGNGQHIGPLVDLDEDNALEVVFGDGNGEVHAVRADGTDLPGFPVHADLPKNLPLLTSPAFDGNPANGEIALSYASIIGGVAVADLDRDSDFDLYLTHFLGQKNTFYRNLGGLQFKDDSRRTRAVATSFAFNGFGIVAFDFDRDAWMDLIVANGHVLGPNAAASVMHPQVLHNNSGRLFDVSGLAGPYFKELVLGRCVGHVAHSYSVETASPRFSSAACSVCQGKVAHFTRTGKSRTPSKAASLSRLSSGSSSLPVRRRWKDSNSALASATVLPFTASVISEAEAMEMAHPRPSKPTSSSFPSFAIR